MHWVPNSMTDVLKKPECEEIDYPDEIVDEYGRLVIKKVTEELLADSKPPDYSQTYTNTPYSSGNPFRGGNPFNTFGAPAVQKTLNDLKPRIGSITSDNAGGSVDMSGWEWATTYVDPNDATHTVRSLLPPQDAQLVPGPADLARKKV